jgi:hypothetical protein
MVDFNELLHSKTTEISLTALNKTFKAIKLGQCESIYKRPNNLGM